MPPKYNSERKHFNADLREGSVSVQLFDGLTKARVKFRMLEELMDCLSFRHPATLFLTTEMLIIFRQQRILWHETVMFVMLLPREKSMCSESQLSG